MPQRMRAGSGPWETSLPWHFLVVSNPVSRHCARHLVGRCCKHLGLGEWAHLVVKEQSPIYGMRTLQWGSSVSKSQGPASSSSRVLRLQSDASAAPFPAQDTHPGLESSCCALLASSRAIKHKEREHCPGWAVGRQLIHHARGPWMEQAVLLREQRAFPLWLRQDGLVLLLVPPPSPQL